MQNNQTVLDFMRRSGFKLTVGSAIISAQLFVQASVWADQLSDVGRNAQIDGQIWRNDFTMPSASGNTLHLGGGLNLNTQDLYPGTSQEGNWFPDGQQPDIDGLKGVFESDSGMGQAGGAQKAKLWQDAHSDNPSVEGAAYKVLLDAVELTQHEQAFESDPSFQATNEVFANAQAFAASFADCSTEQTIRQTVRTAHMPDYQTCERLVRPEVNCDITHTIALEPYSATANLTLLSASGTSDFEIDFKTGTWKIAWRRAYYPFPGEAIPFTLSNGDSWATVNEVFHESTSYPPRVGDYQWVWNDWGYSGWYVTYNGQLVPVPVYGSMHYYDARTHFSVSSGSIFNAPRTTNQWGHKIIGGVPKVDFDKLCASGNAQINIGNISISGNQNEVKHHIYQAPSCANGLVLKMRVKNIRRLKDDHKAPYGNRVPLSFYGISYKSDIWAPQTCIDQARALNGSGFCVADVKVTQGAKNNSECITVNGTNICPCSPLYNKIAPSPVSGVPRLAQRVNVSNVRCGYEREDVCVPDDEGNEICTRDLQYDTDACTALEQNTQCALIRSQCDEDSRDATGRCSLFIDTYDCGYDVEVPTHAVQETVQCAGEIRCLGTDCLDVHSENSTADMANAIAMLQAAQSMGQDAACTGVGTENASCTIFGGKEFKCKKPAGIASGASAVLTNCCKKPQQGMKPSLMEFVMVAIQIPQVQSALGTLAGQALTPLEGAFQSLKSSATKVWGDITKPFVGAAGNATATVAPAPSGTGGGSPNPVNALKAGIKEKAESMLTSFLGGGADASAKAAQIMNAGGAALSMLNTAYISFQVAKLVLGLIWHCKEDDITLDVQKQLKNCVHVGTYCSTKLPLGGCIARKESYCCFNSPLSRIMQEQIRNQPQLGLGWGTPKAPDCSPIDTSLLEQVDWDKLNLDEWIGILHETGQMPDGSKMTMENLTGAGSFLDTSGTRMEVEQRTFERLRDTDVDAARREAADTMSVDVGAP